MSHVTKQIKPHSESNLPLNVHSCEQQEKYGRTQPGRFSNQGPPVQPEMDELHQQHASGVLRPSSAGVARGRDVGLRGTPCQGPQDHPFRMQPLF